MPDFAAPLRVPNATLTHAAVRAALSPEVWALYGRTRAGLGGLGAVYAWDGEVGGWALEISQTDTVLGRILLTREPLTGLVIVPAAQAAAIAAAPELLPDAAARLAVTPPAGEALRVSFSLTSDREILAFLSLTRARAGMLAGAE